MKPKSFSIPFPLFSISCSEDLIIVGGGGGQSKNGVENKILVFTLQNGDLYLNYEYKISDSEDGCMSLALHPFKQALIAGINENTEAVKEGKSKACRFFLIHTDSYLDPN